MGIWDTVVGKAKEAFTAITKIPGVDTITQKMPALKTAMKKVPILGTLAVAAFEIPDVIKGFRNGDGIRQTGRSGLKVGGTMGGMAAGTATAAALGLSGPIGWFVGAGLLIGGAIAGEKIGGGAGNVILGKSIESQKQDYQNLFQQDTAGAYGNMYNMANSSMANPIFNPYSSNFNEVIAQILRDPSLMQKPGQGFNQQAIYRNPVGYPTRSPMMV